jgi:hypothetical protein
MFLLWGLVTIGLGISIFLFLPDNPMKSRLSLDEKRAAIERLRSNMTGIENKKFKISQMIECLTDVHTWMIGLTMILSGIPGGPLGSFQAAIIKQ